MRRRKGYKDIFGYLEEDEAAILQQLAKEKDVLDIGTYYGRSAICFAEVARFVLTIDTHRGMHPNDQVQSITGITTLETFKENIKGYRNIQYIVSTTEEAFPSINEKFDLVFVDAEHLYANVRHDILESLKLLKDDGIIVVHDYFQRIYPDVRKATDEIFKDHSGVFEKKLIWFTKSNLRNGGESNGE